MSIALGLIFSLAFVPKASAQSGFLEDYSIFDNPTEEEIQRLEARYDYVDRVYLSPTMVETMSKHKAIMLDQPEVWLHPESPYQGIKPEAMTALADYLRQKVFDELSKDFEMVSETGPGVAVVEWAITDMYLQKKKKKFYSFTPIGFVATATTLAVMNDIWKKVDMVEIKIEVALYSDNRELTAAAIARQGARKDKEAGVKKRQPVSWDEYDRIVQNMAIQLSCAIKNTRIPEGVDKIDCDALLVRIKEE